MQQQPDPRGKCARQLLELEELPYTIILHNGLDHGVPDCLNHSKAPQDPKGIQNDEKFLDKIFAINIDNKEWQQHLMTAQASDTAISFAIKQLNATGVIREGLFK